MYQIYDFTKILYSACTLLLLTARLDIILSGDIAIDDIGISPGACLNVPTYSDPVAISVQAAGCSFDDNRLCSGWTSQNWTISNDTTPSHGTGPKVDHTGNSGYYLYAEASRPYQLGDRATLTSDVRPATSAHSNGKSTSVCVEFWYVKFDPIV